MIYIQQDELNGLGSWLSRAVSNVGKFVQQTDLVSHAINEVAGDSKLVKVFVPTASNTLTKDQTLIKPKVVLITANATECAKDAFKNDPRCIAFAKTQAIAQQSQQIIDTKEVGVTDINNKSTWIIGGGVGLALLLIVLANSGDGKKSGSDKNSLSGVKKRKSKKKSKK